MKKLLLWTSAFGLAVVIGIGVAVVTFEPALAYSCYGQCPIPGLHATISGDPCTCPNGSHGYVVTKWCGYYSQGGAHCSPYSTFCSACPPYGDKGPWPYYDPGE